MAGAHPGLRDRILLNYTRTENAHKVRKKTFVFVMYRSPQVRTHRATKPPLEKFLSSQEKCVGRILKLLDIVLKTRPPLRKLFAPPGVQSWLRAWKSSKRLVFLFPC